MISMLTDNRTKSPEREPRLNGHLTCDKTDTANHWEQNMECNKAFQKKWVSIWSDYGFPVHIML